ncbi:MAG: lipoprotein-releasing ABC transporter permease subunit LolE [Colwellia sp.]
MFKPLSIFLGLRYVRSRHGNGFSSFISASSTIGIALGVAVLIIVLSTMNGFEKELAQKLLSIIPHAELISVNEPIKNWPASVKKLQNHEQIVAVAPVIKMTGMIQHKGQLKGVEEIRGVEVKLETLVSDIEQYIVKGSWQQLNQANSIVIGSGIAKKLSVNLGDHVQILLPSPKSEQSANHDINQTFAAPLKRTVKVVGIFKFGGTVDDTLAYISLAQASNIMGYKTLEAQGIRLKINNVFQAHAIAKDVVYTFDNYVYINDWTRSQGHIFNDIQLVRLVMFVVLVLVIAVASFNIVSTLVMAVNDKQGDIAILKTMGASSSLIMTVFIFQGLVNGVLGCIIGGFSGVYLAINLPDIIAAIERYFSIHVLSGDVYFIDHLPSYLNMSDVYITLTTALVMTLLATLYPAWQATKIEPAQVLGQL